MRIFIRFLRSLFSWFTRESKPLKTVRAQEIPDFLDPSSVYIVGEGEYLWFVVMICPCGCGNTLQMSLLSEAKPRWKLIEHKDGTISLFPSVWRKIGCCSHFYLRSGYIVWCDDIGQS